MPRIGNEPGRNDRRVMVAKGAMQAGRWQIAVESCSNRGGCHAGILRADGEKLLGIHTSVKHGTQATSQEKNWPAPGACIARNRVWRAVPTQNSTQAQYKHGSTCSCSQCGGLRLGAATQRPREFPNSKKRKESRMQGEKKKHECSGREQVNECETRKNERMQGKGNIYGWGEGKPEWMRAQKKTIEMRVAGSNKQLWHQTPVGRDAAATAAQQLHQTYPAVVRTVPVCTLGAQTRRRNCASSCAGTELTEPLIAEYPRSPGDHCQRSPPAATSILAG